MLANQKVWLAESNGFSTIMPSLTPVSSEASTWQKADSGLASTLLQLSKGSFNVYVDKIRWVGGLKCTNFCLQLCLFWSGPNHFGGVQIIFGEVYLRIFWTNFWNLDAFITNWTWPKRLAPVQNHFGPLEGQGIRVNIIYVEVGSRWPKKRSIFCLRRYWMAPKYVAQSNSDTSKIDSSSVSSHLDVSILSKTKPRDHPYITLAKDWVYGSRKLPVLLTLSTVLTLI